MDKNYIEVVRRVNEYFKEHLPQYTVIEVRRKSYHPEDGYLYMVSAIREDGTYAVWTSWNEAIQSLNHGHYGLPSMEACAKIMTGYQGGSTYNTENSTPLECLHGLLIKNDDNFGDSYHEVLYIMGFVDGITAQQKNNWNRMTDTEVNTLFSEALKN